MIRFAIQWIKNLAAVLQQEGLQWIAPHVLVNDGTVVLEWRNGDRKLTVYVNDDNTVEFVKSAVDEMEDGCISSKLAACETKRVIDLWNWLFETGVQ